MGLKQFDFTDWMRIALRIQESLDHFWQDYSSIAHIVYRLGLGSAYTPQRNEYSIAQSDGVYFFSP
jgi:hypothetical protein